MDDDWLKRVQVEQRKGNPFGHSHAHGPQHEDFLVLKQVLEVSMDRHIQQ